jgi:lecithin:cholesterol acyltransferase
VPRQHVVYVIPGIGGSVLERPPSGGRPARQEWDAGFGDILRLVAQPGRLGPDELLRATGAVRSSCLVPGWTIIPGYEGLIKRLSALPGMDQVDLGHPDQRNPHADLVVFPYDFRLGVAAAARALADDVAWRLEQSGDLDEPRVVVVAHSMGGLIARYWLGPLGGWRHCRALVTLGTPFRGAPKALDVLAHGVRLAGLRLNGVSDLLASWPSVAELLPHYPMIWDTEAGTARRPHELPFSFQAAAKEAFTLHQDIEQAWSALPRSGTQVLPRLGWSHPTPASAHWSGKQLTLSRDWPRWLDVRGWENDQGDGTVPSVSAVPQEMDSYDAAGWLEQERHGFLVNGAWIPGLIQDLEERGTLTRIHGRERQVALGVEIAELQLPGQPVAVEVRVSQRGPGEPVDAAGTEVWATVRRPGEVTRVRAMPLAYNAVTGTFSGELPGLDPGLYDVTVSAGSVKGAGDLSALAGLAVVAP